MLNVSFLDFFEEFRWKLVKIRLQENTIEDAIARNLDVSRSTVSVSRLIFFALKTVNVQIVRILMEATGKALFSIGLIQI